MTSVIKDNEHDELKVELNSFIVLESLSTDHIKDRTGKLIFDEIIQFAEYKIPEFKDKTHFHEFKSKEDFFILLNQIMEKVEIGYKPMIHIECHGSKNGNGLIVKPTDELIEWREIEPYFRSINIKVKNSLFITLAVCYGAKINEIVLVEKASPFFAIIASETEIYPSEIYRVYKDYYTELVLNRNLKSALQIIESSSNFKIWGTQFLYRSFEDELLKMLQNNNVEKAARKLVNKIQRNSGHRKSKKEKLILRKHYERVRKKMVASKILELRKKFLMLDLYPELAKRYRTLNIKTY